jgi:flagellar export protein FliJ
VKSFQFPLQRVLDWRGIQLRAEEEKLAGLLQKLASLLQREKTLTAVQSRSEVAVLSSPCIEGSDLRALSGFRARIKNERAALKTSRAHCEAQIVEQRKRLLKARKDCRILEQLKDKRHKEWTYLGEREIEETAAESYISRWLRSNTEQ